MFIGFIKNKEFFLKILSAFFAVTIFIPSITKATTLPTGGSFDPSNIQMALELLRTQVAGSLQNMPNIAGAQTNLEGNLAKYRSMLDQLGQFNDNLNNLLSLAQGVSGGNIASQLSQIQSLVSAVTSFQRSGDAGNILGNFAQLQALGVPGLSQTSSIFTNGLSKLSQLDQAIAGSKSNAQDIASAATNLDTAQKALTAAKSGIGGGSADTIKKAEEGLAAAQKLYDAAVAKGGDLLSTAASVLNLGSLFDTKSVQDNFQAAGMPGGQNGQKQSVCDKQFPHYQFGGGGNGVPTIEQQGNLLDATGKLVDITSNIKVIDQETCYKIEQLWEKEYKLDPKTREESRKIIAEEKKKFEKFTKEGREQEGTDEKGTFAPVLEDYIKEKEKSAIYRLADTIKNSDSPMKDKAVDYLVTKAEENKAAKIKSLLKPVEVKGNDPWSRLISQGVPQNTPQGISSLVNGELSSEITRAKDLAKTLYVAGGGILPNETCTEWIRGADGNRWCNKWAPVTPAAIISAVAQEFSTSYIHQAENVQEFEQDGTIEQANTVTEETTTYSTGGGGGPIGGGGTGGSDTSGTGNGGGGPNIGDIINQLGGGGTGPGTGGGDTTPTIPAPAITMNQKLENLGNGLGLTIISWSADDYADSCKTSNRWITYAETATTTPRTLMFSNTSIDIDDQTIIDHPALISFSVQTTGIGRIVNAPQTITSSKERSGSGFKQTIKYEPNLLGVIETDIFNIYINNQILSISYDGETKEEFVQKIKTNMELVPADSPKGKIFSSLTKTIEGSSIVFSTSTINVLPSADYEMTCSNFTGKESTKKITVEFFR